MNLSYLYNIDYTRTTVYTQDITVPDVDTSGTYSGYARVYLDHIPKVNTLSIDGITLIEDGLPVTGQALIDFREAYDYANATGLLVFAPGNSGHTYSCRYIPIASRIDASVVNELIRVGNHLGDATYTITDLNTAGDATVLWENVKNRPDLATEDTDGLLAAGDKIKLNAIPYNSMPIGAIQVNASMAQPTSWGGAIQFIESATLTPRVDGNKVYFDVNISSVEQTTAAMRDAMKGTSGTPSAVNPFVTNSDGRLSDARIPLAHKHAIEDVLNLVTELNGKASATHTHTASEIQDIPTIQGPRGETGPQGATGPKGEQGDTGPIGPQGIQGEIGPQGLRGPEGPVGPMGTIENSVQPEDLFLDCIVSGYQLYELDTDTTHASQAYGNGHAYLGGYQVELTEANTLQYVYHPLALTSPAATSSVYTPFIRGQITQLSYDDTLTFKVTAVDTLRNEVTFDITYQPVSGTAASYTGIGTINNNTIAVGTDTYTVNVAGTATNYAVADSFVFTYQQYGITRDYLTTTKYIAHFGYPAGTTTMPNYTGKQIGSSADSMLMTTNVFSATGFSTTYEYAYTPIIRPATTPILTNAAVPTSIVNVKYVQDYTASVVNKSVNDVLNAAPAALDTLKELADALGDDPNFATTMTNQLATKVDKADTVKVATANKLLYADATGKLPTDITGNASTSTKLATSRTINGLAFDGTANIQVEHDSTYKQYDVNVSGASATYFPVSITQGNYFSPIMVTIYRASSEAHGSGDRNTALFIDIDCSFTGNADDLRLIRHIETNEAGNASYIPQVGKIQVDPANGKLIIWLLGGATLYHFAVSRAATITNPDTAYTSITTAEPILDIYEKLTDVYVSTGDVTHTAAANKILYLNAVGALPADITGSAPKLGGIAAGLYALKTDIPTKLTQLTNDGNFVRDAAYVHTDCNFTQAEKDKLASMTYGSMERLSFAATDTGWSASTDADGYYTLRLVSGGRRVIGYVYKVVADGDETVLCTSKASSTYLYIYTKEKFAGYVIVG